MNVLDAIRQRRSVGRVSQRPVPRSLLENALEAAHWAPTHHRTEPWRFWVFSGPGRERLAQVFALLGEKDRAKPLRAPVVIAVACVPQPAADNIQEELCATAAAVQNLLLAAQGLGLAGIWRTGPAAYDARVRQFFGLGERDALVGFIYLGYPDPDVPVLEGRRTSLEDKTVWYE